MLVNQNNYLEEVKPLFRLLKNEAFRFIIIGYNNYSMVNQLQYDLKMRFSDRPFLKVDGKHITYKEFMETYYHLKKGFLFAENFHEILNNPDFTYGLNQRRDKLAKYLIALIVFIPSSGNDLFARNIVERIPDLWSFRSLVLNLKTIHDQFLTLEKEIRPDYLTSNQGTIGGNTIEKKQEELKRLLSRLKNIPQNEYQILKLIYEQIALLLEDLNRSNEAIEYLLKLEKIQLKFDDLVGLGKTYNDLGYLNSQIRDFDNAISFYEKSLNLRHELDNKASLGTTFNNTGGLYNEKGNRGKAFEYYLMAEQMFLKSNYAAGLGAVYNNIGGYYIFEKNWNEALSYLKKSEDFRFKSGDFKNLGVTYFNLGVAYSKLKEFEKSLSYFLSAEKILSEYNTCNKIKEVQKTIGDTYNSLGIAFSEKGDFQKALDYHFKAEKIRYQISDYSGVVKTLYNIGMEWLKLKDSEKAINYFILAGYIAKDRNLSFELKQMEWALNEVIKKHGEVKFYEIGKENYLSWLKHFEKEKSE